MSTISKVCTKAVDEVRNVAVDMRGKLDPDEVLLDNLVIVEVTSADLTLSSRAISVDDLLIEDDTVPAGQAVQFEVAGGVKGKTYTIRITVNTSSSPPQTLIENIKLRITAD